MGSDEPDAMMFSPGPQRVDVVGRIDDDREALVLVTDEGTGAAQIVVQELPEEHGATQAPASAMYPKVPPARAHAPRRAPAARTSRSRTGTRWSARRS